MQHQALSGGKAAVQIHRAYDGFQCIGQNRWPAPTGTFQFAFTQLEGVTDIQCQGQFANAGFLHQLRPQTA